jgi:hypothetical protein
VSAFIRFLKDGSVAPRTEHDEGLDRLAVLTWSLSDTKRNLGPSLDIVAQLDRPCLQVGPGPASDSEDSDLMECCKELVSATHGVMMA